MNIAKTIWNKGLHTPKIQELLDNNIVWCDKTQHNWNRKCPSCNKIITSSSKRAFEICIRSHAENRACRSCGRKKTKQNLIGKKFGKLVVIGEAPYRKTDPGPYWKCKCECGKITEVKTRSLIGGITKTCGSISHQWKGYEEISGRYYSHLKSGARQRDIIFSITLEEMWNEFISQNRRCFFTGELLTFGQNGTASLDRIDSSMGYVKGNVQWVHKDINKMKNAFSVERFIELCQLVATHTAKVA